MRQAVDRAVYLAVRETVKAPRVEVWEVYRGVDQGFYIAMKESVYWSRRKDPPHPGLSAYLAKVTR